MVIVVVILLVVLFFNCQMFEMVQGRDYKDGELLLFLSWLAMDNSEREQ